MTSHPANDTSNLQLWVLGWTTYCSCSNTRAQNYLTVSTTSIHYSLTPLEFMLTISCNKGIPKQVITGEKKWTARYCAKASQPKTATSQTLGYISLISMGQEIVLLFCFVLCCYFEEQILMLHGFVYTVGHHK